MVDQPRTDQVGSLIRPTKLLQARDDFQARRLSADGLREIEDEAILACLEDQRRVGVEVLTDGEFRRDAFNTGPSQAIDGFVDEYPVVEQRRPDGVVARVELHGKPVRGKLRQMRRIAGDDATFLKRHAPGPFKITMISPNGITHLWRAGVTDPAVYPSEEELRSDVETIFKAEVAALVADGASYVQFDEGFVRFINAATMEGLRQQGVDLDAALQADIASENACYELLPEGVLAACHLCRGNRVPWGGGSGSYDWLAERLFNALRVDRFLLEYDTERAGGFEGLRFLPKGKIVALGLVSTKKPELEQQDDLLRRIDEAARYCPIEQLALCPQCGFQSSSTRDGQFIPVEQQWRKLELIAETAAKVWGATGASRFPLH
jgi:5-methyltetrahydropteroyltriglutamate--homocysteine methyltransferase